VRVQEALHWWHGPSALLYSALLLVILLVVACQAVRPSVRLSVWDAVWGRARVVLGVSGVCVSGACSRGSSSSSSSTTCCVLQLLFGSRYCMDGWVGAIGGGDE
jgi:steroid 5-alpha reductase family enzyme